MSGPCGASGQPQGWNTWDVDIHTGMVHLPSMRRIRFGVPGAGGYTWRDGLVRLGPHTPDGSYAEVTVDGLHLEMADDPVLWR